MMKTRASLLIVNYFLGYEILYPLLTYLLLASEFYVFTIPTIIALAITVLLVIPKLREDFKKTKVGKLLVSGILQTLLMFGIIVVIAVIFTGLGIEDNSLNQKLLEEYFAKPEFRLIISLMILFFAPLVEESVFRFALASLISKNKVLFVVVSALLFGAVHLVEGMITGDFADLLNIAYYGLLGVLLALNYLRHDENLWYPIIAHMLYNGVQLWLMNLLL